MSFETMFSPIEIGSMTVKNRFVVPPMGNNFANTDGTWSEQSIAYYAERARGGFGLVTVEATVVHEGAKGGPRKPCLYDDGSVASLSRIAEACHAHGAKVSVQLQNAGPEGNAKNAGAPLQAASPIPSACGRDVPREVPVEKVYELVRGYGDAAERALRAGVDAVEIHMAHGYLVGSFISQRTNKRVDEFGGSFENRMRFPRLIVEEVRRRVGDRAAVIARINASDEMLGGLDVHDAAAVASYLEACGVACLHVSRAVHIKDEYMWAPTAVHGGFNADLVSEIKRAVHVPVIAVGRFTDPYYAELLVREGRADLIAFGRQSLADPHLPLKTKKGCSEDVVPCIACLQGCVARMYRGEPIRLSLIHIFLILRRCCRSRSEKKSAELRMSAMPMAVIHMKSLSARRCAKSTVSSASLKCSSLKVSSRSEDFSASGASNCCLMLSHLSCTRNSASMNSPVSWFTTGRCSSRSKSEASVSSTRSTTSSFGRFAISSFTARCVAPRTTPASLMMLA